MYMGGAAGVTLRDSNKHIQLTRMKIDIRALRRGTGQHFDKAEPADVTADKLSAVRLKKDFLLGTLTEDLERDLEKEAMGLLL